MNRPRPIVLNFNKISDLEDLTYVLNANLMEDLSYGSVEFTTDSGYILRFEIFIDRSTAKYRLTSSIWFENTKLATYSEVLPNEDDENDKLSEDFVEKILDNVLSNFKEPIDDFVNDLMIY